MAKTKDWSKPTKNTPSQCSAGWFTLTKAGYALCKKCGSRYDETCKAETRNPNT